MQVVYAIEPLPEVLSQSIFLAGPTPRGPGVLSWREDALRILEELDFQGTVFVPEPRNGVWSHDYDHQVDWEMRARQASDAILFWVPRELVHMPAMTTNVEFGVDLTSGKMTYGRPPEAPKNKYLDHLWTHMSGEAPVHTLQELLHTTLATLGAPAPRQGGARMVPLHIWHTAPFQAWYQALLSAGHRLDGAEIKAQVPLGRLGHIPFLWMMQAEIWIADEDRPKSCEVVITRPDTAVVVPVYRPGTEDARVILVEEFRSAVRTPLGRVVEPPGGSVLEVPSMRMAAGLELEEEIGLQVDAQRLVALGARQVASSLLTHQAHVFALELTDDEHTQVVERQGTLAGVGEERLRVHSVAVSDLGQWPLDWAALGMVQSALHAFAAPRHALQSAVHARPPALEHDLPATLPAEVRAMVEAP